MNKKTYMNANKRYKEVLVRDIPSCGASYMYHENHSSTSWCKKFDRKDKIEKIIWSKIKFNREIKKAKNNLEYSRQVRRGKKSILESLSFPAKEILKKIYGNYKGYRVSYDVVNKYFPHGAHPPYDCRAFKYLRLTGCTDQTALTYLKLK